MLLDYYNADAAVGERNEEADQVIDLVEEVVDKATGG